MACNHSHSYKAYSGNNRANLSFTILIYSFVQKLLSSSCLIVLWSNCLLCTVGFSCNANNSGLQSATHSKASPNRISRCIGTITTLGIGDSVEGCITVDLDPLYKKRKWKQVLSKVKLFHDKGSIQNLLYVIAYDCHRGVRFKRIDANANLSDYIAVTNAIDAVIPNWKDYGIPPFMLCQRSSFGNKHIFSLDLNGVQFQNGEQLGFILVQNNSSPVDLVKYLVKKDRQWPDGPTYTHIKDYLILPGAIGKRTLQSESVFDSTIDLTSYTTIYCYMKRGHHYCFVPLDLFQNSIAKWPFYGLYASNTAECPEASPKNCASQIALPPYTSNSIATNPSPLKENNGLAQEMGNVERSATPLPPKNSSSIARKPVTPSDPGYNNLNKKINDATRQHKLLDMVKLIKRFKRNQGNVVKTIKRIKIIASNDAVKNTIRPDSVNKMQLALSSALKAIQSLKSAALNLAKGYHQLGKEDSSATDLSNKRIAVIQTLKNLEEAVYEECLEVESAEVLLNQVIEHLEATYHILFNLDETDNMLDEIDNMNNNVKQLFIGNRMKLKKEKARTIVAQLEKMTFDQKNVTLGFRKKIPEIQETLTTIQKDLATSIHDPLKAVKSKIGVSNLKHALKLKGNIVVVEGELKNTKCIKGIIMDLELEGEAIKEMVAIFNSVDKEEIAKKIKKAVNNALNLEKKFKIKIQSKSKEMVDQVEGLKKLLPKMKRCYDSGYEEAFH